MTMRQTALQIEDSKQGEIRRDLCVYVVQLCIGTHPSNKWYHYPETSFFLMSRIYVTYLHSKNESRSSLGFTDYLKPYPLQIFTRTLQCYKG